MLAEAGLLDGCKAHHPLGLLRTGMAERHPESTVSPDRFPPSPPAKRKRIIHPPAGVNLLSRPGPLA